MKFKNSSKFNNIQRNRSIIREAAANDIQRFSANKGYKKLKLLNSTSQNEINQYTDINKLIRKACTSHINEELSILDLLNEINDVGKVSKVDLYNDIFVVYDKLKIESNLDSNNPNVASLRAREASLNATDNVSENDIKSYIGARFLDIDSFNRPEKKTSRLSNPNFSLIKVKNHINTFKNTEDAKFVSFIGTMIPPIEMSKCVPHLNILLVDDDKNPSNRISLGKFLVGKSEFKNDGFARGLASTTIDGKGDEIFKMTKFIRKGKEYKQNISGMEIFQSPGSLINSDINRFQSGADRVLNPFLPFMSIESFSISDELLPKDMYSTTSGTLSLKLFDRTRLSDIKKLIGKQYLMSVFLIIEFGWSHPEGSIISNNRFGQFLDSLKRRELYVVSDSKININDDGSVNINLNIKSFGTVNKGGTSSLSQKYITVEKLNEYIDALKQKLKSAMGEDVYKITLKNDYRKMNKIFNTGYHVNDLILIKDLTKIDFYNKFEEIIKDNNSDYVALKTKINNLLKALTDDILVNKELESIDADVQGSSGNKKNEETKATTGTDKTSKDSEEKSKAAEEKAKEEAKQMFYNSSKVGLESIINFIDYGDTCMNTTVDGLYFDTEAALSIVNDNTGVFVDSSIANNVHDTSTIIKRLKMIGVDISKDQQYNYQLEYGNIKRADLISRDIRNSYITLGRLLSHEVFLPEMLGNRDHDEYQVFFHPANQQSGAFFNISLADVFISTKSYLNEVAKLMYSKNTSNLSTDDKFGIINKILKSDNPYETGYGLSIIRTENDDGGQEINIEEMEQDESSTKTEEEKENISKEKSEARTRNFRLRMLYSKNTDFDSNTLDFKVIDLKVKKDTVSYDDNGEIKRILKIHVHDNNASLFKDERVLIQSISNTEIQSIIKAVKTINNNSDNSNGILKKFTRNFSKKYYNINESDIETFNNNVKNTEQGISVIDNFINDEIIKNIDEIMKSKMPTLELGTNNAIIQNISIGSSNGSAAERVAQLDYARTKLNSQNDDISQNKSILLVNPTTITVNMLGMPIISIGQEFYITSQTHTTLDNVYVVDGISHSISGGSFTTTLNLSPRNDVGIGTDNLIKSIATLLKV